MNGTVHPPHPRQPSSHLARTRPGGRPRGRQIKTQGGASRACLPGGITSCLPNGDHPDMFTADNLTAPAAPAGEAGMTAAGPQTRPGPLRSRWLLPDDGIIDEIAVSIAAAGIGPVALTRAERRLAAERILARGGSHGQIATRLHMSYSTARTLTAEIRQATGTAARDGQAGDAA